jgi:hypothetical protein
MLSKVDPINAFQIGTIRLSVNSIQLKWIWPHRSWEASQIDVWKAKISFDAWMVNPGYLNAVSGSSRSPWWSAPMDRGRQQQPRQCRT